MGCISSYFFVMMEGPLEFFVYYGWMTRKDIPLDVMHVRIDLSVRAIKDWAFSHPMQLEIVILNEELEEIGELAFDCCRSIHEIVIPNAVKKIKKATFTNCSSLTAVTLGNGLEEIGRAAFANCTLLHEIVIAPTFKRIKDQAFCYC
jgi:hypothetical protein